MIAAKKVTIIIVTYESGETIGWTLDGLRTAYEAGYASCIVVDNASTDGTADYIAEQYPWVTLLRSRENLGFGRGCNLGFQSVETPYVLFLNPDARIELPSLEVLADFMDAHPAAGIVGPATEVDGSGHQFAGLLLTPARLVRAALGCKEKYDDARVIEPGEPPFKTTWICGAVFMVRSIFFRELGGFDPRFFLYFEETDLCLRAMRRGMEIWAVGEATSEHIVGASAKKGENELIWGCIAEYFYPSRFYYLAKNFGWIRAITVELISGLLDWIRWQRKAFRNRGDGPCPERPKRPFLQLPDAVDIA